jgi:hypothetical protein
MEKIIHFDIARVLAVIGANGALHNSMLYTTI